MRSWNVLQMKTFGNFHQKRMHESFLFLTSAPSVLSVPQVCWACRRVWTCTGTSSAQGGAASVRDTPRPSSARWNSRYSQRGWAASQNWVSSLLQFHNTQREFQRISTKLERNQTNTEGLIYEQKKMFTGFRILTSFSQGFSSLLTSHDVSMKLWSHDNRESYPCLCSNMVSSIRCEW